MRFAKIVFRVAGIWGLLVITPLYFMFDLIGRNDPPPITHPGFFYGFLGVALAWQVAFIFIATDPPRYRPLMIPCVLEKAGYGAAVVILVLQGRMHKPDLLLPAQIYSSAFSFSSPTSRHPFPQLWCDDSPMCVCRSTFNFQL